MRKWTCTIVTLGCWGFVGCTGITVHADRLDAVKTAAVVGFSARVGRPPIASEATRRSWRGASSSPVERLATVKSGREVGQRSGRAAVLYDRLVEILSRDFEWHVWSRQRLMESTYPKWMRAQLSPVGRGLFTKSGRYLHVDGVVWALQAELMSWTDRQALAEALGVDALLIVHIRFDFDSVDAESTLRPKATVEVRAYDAVADEPIWFDGEAYSTSQSKTVHIVDGQIDEASFTEALEEAAKLAYEQVIERCNARKH